MRGAGPPYHRQPNWGLEAPFTGTLEAYLHKPAQARARLKQAA